MIHNESKNDRWIYMTAASSSGVHAGDSILVESQLYYPSYVEKDRESVQKIHVSARLP